MNNKSIITKIFFLDKKVFPIISLTIILVSLAIFGYRAYKQASFDWAAIISEDLEKLSSVISKIDGQCNIISITDDNTAIDFLNVGTFDGSVLGPLNFAYPQNWSGPYFKTNLTFKSIYYELFRAREGHFVVPGKGTKLPNGFVMGKDIVLKPFESIVGLIAPGGKLNFKGAPLAKKINLKLDELKTPGGREKDAGDLIEEFSEGMSFATSV